MRREIENKVEALERDIISAKQVRNQMEIDEQDIHDFIAHAKTLVEHPTKILANVGNLREQLALYGLFFEQFPTYEELANGTPKLSLVFGLSQEDTPYKTQIVTLRGIEPRFEA